MRYDQAVTRGHVVCGLGSYRTGDKTGEDDGEDGCVNEKFHDWVTSGGCVFRFCVEEGNNQEYSSRNSRACVFKHI